jgi:small subunit ribosomal protein S16
MAVHIRMTRRGGKKFPHYRIVVTDQRARRDGGSIEIIGTYNPADAANTIVLDRARLAYWQSQGAKLSDTVAGLLKKNPPPPATA